MSDFYEDDEPIEDVVAAWKAGGRKLVFPDTRVFVDVWCSICAFGFQPTGWFDSDGHHITFDELLALWQDVHDDNGACKCEISYKILEKEGPGVLAQEDD